ncbi:helix-turn-helix domain-containing protein [Salinisphaera hydrothermalis]|uniref:helix-turn-helix domain-containing protein n=1 Tax=Salinisphaera hydrothermalis TaxID=563188 RepID=UPI00334262AE
MCNAQSILGSCIRAIRQEKGLSQQQLANRCGISYQYLSGIETGNENFTIGVLSELASALDTSLRVLVSVAHDNAAGNFPPTVSPDYFRPSTPLPEGLSHEDLEKALNHCQAAIHRINRNLLAETGVALQSVIQGNNFSGLISNLLSNSFDECTNYKHNHHQRYPDLIEQSSETGLELKSTIKIGKGGESHNGHSGWHCIACFKFLPNDDIQFIHVMFAVLNSHAADEPDWTYVGSRTNSETGSRRTETYNTNLFGLTKLRDGSAYLDTSEINFSRWKQRRRYDRPDYSIWADGELI